jgi:hypothetical protein
MKIIKHMITRSPYKSHEIAEFRMEVAIAIQKFSRQRLLLMMGMLNSYAWRIAEDWGAIAKEDGRWVVDGEKLRKLAIACHEGKGTLHNALTCVRDYISKYWKFACQNIKTIRAMRSRLKSLGLFDFEEVETKEVFKQGKLHRIPMEATIATPEIVNVDFLELLLAYQVCDRALKAKIQETEGRERELTPEELDQIGGDITTHGWQDGITKKDCMPSHGGALMIEMFNNCFSRQYHEYNDDIAFVAPRGEILKPVKRAIAYKWKKTFTLGLKKWADIHRRKFGSYGSFFLDCVFGEKEDNSLADVPY